jgi:hypothetical protein
MEGYIMELTISETRIIIDALEFKFAHLQEEQAKLDDSQQDMIAELSNDMYVLELLIGRLTDDYTERVTNIEHEYREYVTELPKAEATVFVKEDTESYTNIHKK